MITSLPCQGEARILDAPRISHDYYLNVIDWGKTNLLAAALDRKLYLWNANTCKVELVSEASEGDYLASVNWSENGEVVAAGYSCSKIHLYDAESLHLVSGPMNKLIAHYLSVNDVGFQFLLCLFT